MKRYLAFAGDLYYPRGGWSDFRGSFETPELAALNVSGRDWWHVIDVETGEEVKSGYREELD